MAELEGEAMLMYLIDIAIIEAEARTSDNSLETLIAPSSDYRERLFIA